MASAAVAPAREKIFDSPQEVDLVRRAKQGDEMAFTTLYQNYQSRVTLTIQKLVKDENAADWLANRAMTKVWMNIAGFDERSKFSTWITRIAINEGLMYLRAEKAKASVPVESLDSFLDMQNSDGRTSSAVFHQRCLASRDLELEGIADRQLLEQALSNVPVTYREILRLRFWEGLSIEQLMEHYHVKPHQRSTVKTRILRARMMLKKQIDRLS